MRRMLVVLVWVVATAGVTYVANAAVELVDLQVFPQGARIEVLARAQPASTTLPRMRATTTPPVVTTTVPAPVTTIASPATTVVVPVSTTTTVVVATTVAPTTTVAVVPTTTVVGAPATATTAPPVATTTRPPTTTTGPPPTTTRPPPTTTEPPPTTTRPPATTTTTTTTTTMASVAPLVVLEQGPGDHRIGTDYRERLVTGGDGPFELSVVSGGIPPGLEIDDEGYLWGKLEVSGRFEARLEVADSAGRTGSGTISIFVKEFRIITARGGSVTVVVAGNSVEFFSALQGADFESAQILRSGPLVVEVSFVPKVGDETSWVRCEVVDGVSCTHD